MNMYAIAEVSVKI